MINYLIVVNSFKLVVGTDNHKLEISNKKIFKVRIDSTHMSQQQRG